MLGNPCIHKGLYSICGEDDIVAVKPEKLCTSFSLITCWIVRIGCVRRRSVYWTRVILFALCSVFLFFDNKR